MISTIVTIKLDTPDNITWYRSCAQFVSLHNLQNLLCNLARVRIRFWNCTAHFANCADSQIAYNIDIQGGPKKLAPTDLSIHRFICKKSTVILHVHQLRNDSILYQVVCAASSIKYSMVPDSRYSDASVIAKYTDTHSNWRHTLHHTWNIWSTEYLIPTGACSHLPQWLVRHSTLTKK